MGCTLNMSEARLRVRFSLGYLLLKLGILRCPQCTFPVGPTFLSGWSPL